LCLGFDGLPPVDAAGVCDGVDAGAGAGVLLMIAYQV